MAVAGSNYGFSHTVFGSIANRSFHGKSITYLAKVGFLNGSSFAVDGSNTGSWWDKFEIGGNTVSERTGNGVVSNGDATWATWTSDLSNTEALGGRTSGTHSLKMI